MRKSIPNNAEYEYWYDVKAFQDRLKSLMDKKGLNPNSLGKELCKLNLVNVTQSEKKNVLPSDSKKNKLGSVVKKIRAHLAPLPDNADKLPLIQGEFINAYCRFFECSADYLLGYSDIKTRDIKKRTICNKTGLSDGALTRMMNEPHFSKTFWSSVIDSDLYSELTLLESQAFNQYREMLQAEAALAAMKIFLKDKDKDKDSNEYYIVKSKEKLYAKAKEDHEAAVYGILNRM